MLMLNSIHSDYFEGLIIIDPVGHPLHSCELKVGRIVLMGK